MTKLPPLLHPPAIRPQVKPYGIDVLVFHPSPVATRFYDKAHKIDMLDFFKQFAITPEALPDTVFASIGNTVWRDIGPTAICFRLLMKVSYACLPPFPLQAAA